MVRALAGKESRESLRSVRTFVVLPVSCPLIPISAFVTLQLLDRIERDPQASADLDFVTEPLDFAKQVPSLKQSDGNAR